MSELDDYDKRCGREALTVDQVTEHVASARRYLERADETTACEQQRVMVWLDDMLTSALETIEDPPLPPLFRCGWCYRASGADYATWSKLPQMDLDAVQAHAMICEHNPLVNKIAELEARLALLDSPTMDRGGQ